MICPLHEKECDVATEGCQIPRMLSEFPIDIVENAIAKLDELMEPESRAAFWNNWASKNKGVQRRLLEIQILRKS